MNTDPNSLSQIQSLLGGASSGSGSGVSLLNTDAITKALLPITIVLSVLSVIVTALYIAALVQRIRTNRAIIESRDILREMNERDKARLQPVDRPTNI